MNEPMDPGEVAAVHTILGAGGVVPVRRFLKDVLDTLGRFVLVLLVTSVGLLAVGAFMHVHPLEEGTARTLVFNVFPFLSILLVTLALERFLPPRGAVDAGLSRRNAGRLFSAGVLLSAGWLGVALAIVAATGQTSLFLEKLVPSWTLAVVALAVLLNVAFQQILTRGYLHGAIEWKFGVWPAIVVTSLFFTVLHPAAFTAGPLAAINLMTAGLIFGVSRALAPSIWLAVGLHFTWNFSVSVVLGLPPASYDLSLGLLELGGDPRWTGGAHGFEAGLAVTVANAVLLAGLAGYLFLKRARGRSPFTRVEFAPP